MFDPSLQLELEREREKSNGGLPFFSTCFGVGSEFFCDALNKNVPRVGEGFID